MFPFISVLAPQINSSLCVSRDVSEREEFMAFWNGFALREQGCFQFLADYYAFVRVRSA